MANAVHTIDEVFARLRQGFYPYYDRDNEAFYWDRDTTRSIVELTPRAVRKARSMLRRIPEDYRITWNTATDAVLDNLGDEHVKEETWVDDEVQCIYQIVLRSGHLQTVEAYNEEGTLCGGLLGIRLGKAFSAETMFGVRPNASKACLCHLVIQLAAEGMHFVDVQVAHQADHPVHRIGETTMPMSDYLTLLHAATPDLRPSPRDLRELSHFPGTKSDWADATPSLVEGRRGKTLYIHGFQMIQDWEEPLMRRMGRAVSQPGGRVLEIGYGLGISAEAVQASGPAWHVIVEANKETASAARERYSDAITQDRVQVIDGFWQDVLADWPGGTLPVGHFSGIVFDPYPLSVRELRCPSFDFFPLAAKLLAPGGRFTYYSDESDDISPNHLERIHAYFPGVTISTERVAVQPWPDCEYWESSTILHVVITTKAAE